MTGAIRQGNNSEGLIQMDQFRMTGERTQSNSKNGLSLEGMEQDE